MVGHLSIRSGVLGFDSQHCTNQNQQPMKHTFIATLVALCMMSCDKTPDTWISYGYDHDIYDIDGHGRSHLKTWTVLPICDAYYEIDTNGFPHVLVCRNYQYDLHPERKTNHPRIMSKYSLTPGDTAGSDIDSVVHTRYYEGWYSEKITIWKTNGDTVRIRIMIEDV